MAPLLSSLGFRVALFNVAYFAGSGFHLPYLPVILHARGYGDSEIGLILATAMFLRVFFMPPLGGWIDRLADRATAVKVLGGITLAGLSLFTFSHSFFAVLVSTVLFTLPFQCVGPISDTISLTMERRGVAGYGTLRSIGSASFLACNLAGGVVLAVYGPHGVFLALVAALGFMTVSAFQLPGTSGRGHSIPAEGGDPAKARASLWRQRDVMQVITSNAFVQGSHAVLNGFATLFWAERGFSAQASGALWATGVISEIMVFQFVAPRFRGTDPRVLIVLGAGVAMVRWTLFPLPYDLNGAFLLQLMHSGSFAIAHLGTMRFILKRVGEGQAAAAQGINVMLCGLTQAVCTALAGPLFHAYGGLAFFPMVFPALFGACLAVAEIRRRPAGGPGQ